MTSGGDVLAADEGELLPRGATVLLQLLPTANSAEHYVLYNPERSRVEDAVEALRVAWYVSAGELTESRQVHHADEAGDGQFATSWVLPDAGGSFHAWAVLRDDRGGLAWASYSFRAQ